MEACTFVSPQLHLFEFGNEFNFAAGKYRAANPPLLDYADEWTFQSAIVRAAVRKACPEPFPGLMAPSLVFLLDFSSNTTWAAEYLYNLGYDKHNLTRELCFHNHMGVNSPPLPPADFDLQRSLMNHTNIMRNPQQQLQRSESLAYFDLPYTLGELNSVANQGRNGETDVLGDAL